ncbi:hypothetical protein D9O40_05075 [Clostridium autoethanogenum]|uniref:Uncharacterized protein n=1 Tax=Clostridium autoethanogenum TaxID=84023 RepID=A0A3M0SWA1_9CLOT|nr:hypothetical protein [Clostridium autoethanogenum]RMD02677.1 hypothetical protein D9O40_05075 [Clostridium autoethanogenum]
MDNNLLSWIIDQVDKEKLLNICSEKIVISGFRDPKRAPKKCIANKLLKNKEKLFVDLKKYADKLEINDKFKDKTFEEIEKLIDIEYKNEIIELVIYLSTRSKDQYTNLANKVIDLISQKHVETKKCIDEKNLEHENFKKIDDLCKIIKTQQINLNELKKNNNKLLCNNKKLKTKIENYKNNKIKLHYLILTFKQTIEKLKNNIVTKKKKKKKKKN